MSFSQQSISVRYVHELAIFEVKTFPSKSFELMVEFLAGITPNNGSLNL